MRVALLALAVFCALISGWTASLARTQGIDGIAATHHAGAVSSHAASGKEHDCAAKTDGCDHHPQTVHPLLCAACFAVMLSAPDLDRGDPGATRIAPLTQKPMQALAPEPLCPPPKTFVRIS